MRGKLVIVTGGNVGIGRATAQGLAAMGARVVLTSRDLERGRAVASEIARETGADVRALRLDLASFASIRAFAAEILEAEPRIDVLVANAGLILSDRRTTSEGFEATFGVNHLGHFLLTELLLDRIVESAPARIVVVSSRAHRRARGIDFGDLQRTGRYVAWKVYAESKLANLLFVRALAARLEDRVTVNACHPGVVATGFAGGGDARGLTALFFRLARPLLRTPEQGAETVIWLASAPELAGVSGRYFVDRREVVPSRAARDDGLAARLWDESERLVAIGSR
jgi:NAD(P)-dependent dehydrogenase (short-subunit alcohol dehydrogenase family)